MDQGYLYQHFSYLSISYNNESDWEVKFFHVFTLVKWMLGIWMWLNAVTAVDSIDTRHLLQLFYMYETTNIDMIS